MERAIKRFVEECCETPDTVFTADGVARLIEVWVKRRGERGEPPDKEATLQRLYFEVDQLVEKVFKEEPQLDSGDCDSLKITLWIEAWDEKDNPIAGMTVAHKSERSG